MITLLLASVLGNAAGAPPPEADRARFAAVTQAAREANATEAPMVPGPFQPTWDSLKAYQVPEWFRDAKFGLWAHWGPQAQPEMGDWYARFLYIPENKLSWARPIYGFHLARYGHPSRYGFKDVIRTWHAEHWDPVQLMALYKRAGAQYFMALANHHDNFDLWDSKYQPWNSTVLGPKKDIIGGWAAAARAAGLRFGVSVHGARAWNWYEVSQGADKSGPKAGIPYDGRLTAADGKGKWWDGLDPQDLYAQDHPVGTEEHPTPPSPEYLRKFYNRTVDLIGKYHPDLVYFDDTVLPFIESSDVGLKITADLYNQSLSDHGGKLEAVVTGKHLSADQARCLVNDIERGRSSEIVPQPWQTDTCIGEWHYSRSLYERNGYKTAAQVIQMLADIVSKNGNLMLNIPVRGDGSLDDEELAVLEQLAAWMDVNHEAIFATRPWAVYGEGPSTAAVQEKGGFGGIKDFARFTSEDVRFTRSKDERTVYALVLGPPQGQLRFASLGRSAGRLDREIEQVELLGGSGAAQWTQTDAALVIQSAPPSTFVGALVYKIRLKA